ncbi:hypothetical protein HPQ64_02000 [Rhizobiales bacterium]|uniref:hypothetical protein n=1 Tax=Hongsoonwoonella zoysiae TaxID=2821844 RepID=UPI0015610183|nr:hypothetical protein [Hongsoonwoonella zoysiae]NRG16456.1 hypothetical protein [Hongsoonwoonella zoysiae]
MRAFKWFAALSVMTLGLYSTPVSAQDLTPTDAFQRAAQIKSMVLMMLEADLYDVKDLPDPAIVPSRPRHVLRVAVDVFERIQTLRLLNGLAENPAPTTEAKPTRAADVVAVLEQAASELQELGPIYGVNLKIDLPGRDGDRTPGEVLAHLRAINDGLVLLGVPVTLPNDVQRTALEIRQEMTKVASLKGAPTNVKAEAVKSAMPSDALSEVMGLIDDLRNATENDASLALPSGVAVPPVPEGGKTIRPADVLLAAQFALADVYALNVALGDKNPLERIPTQAGKNPADVKNAIAGSRAQLAAIVAAE